MISSSRLLFWVFLCSVPCLADGAGNFAALVGFYLPALVLGVSRGCELALKLPVKELGWVLTLVAAVITLYLIFHPLDIWSPRVSGGSVFMVTLLAYGLPQIPAWMMLEEE